MPAGAVSLSTMHDLQWHEGDLSDGDTEEWSPTGWRPWLAHLGTGEGGTASADELKARGNDAFREKKYKTAHGLYSAALCVGGSIGDTAATKVGRHCHKSHHFQRKNRHFRGKNHHFQSKNRYFLLKNHHFCISWPRALRRVRWGGQVILHQT